MDVAGRYLSSDSHIGVGGDWFDVIPLSGARVALVVGDVVGHGIAASAAMGAFARPCVPSPMSIWPRTSSSPTLTTLWSAGFRARLRCGGVDGRTRSHLPVRGLRPHFPHALARQRGSPLARTGAP